MFLIIPLLSYLAVISGRHAYYGNVKKNVVLKKRPIVDRVERLKIPKRCGRSESTLGVDMKFSAL